MKRRIVLPIMFLFAISIFVIPAFAETIVSSKPFFTVLPNRQHGIAVSVVLGGNYDSSLFIWVIVDQMWPYYEPSIEEGFGDGAGIIFTEPNEPYGVEPNTTCAVHVGVYRNNVLWLLGMAYAQINDYGTIDLPIQADLLPFST